MRVLALTLVAGLLVVGCGEERQAATNPRVKLELALPGDGGTTFEDRVQIRGSVTPADAAVQVAGDDAEVEGGEFRADVPLQPGGNVIDVSASAPGRRPATDAVRVVRDMRVRVPEVVGLDFDQAADALGEAGLNADEQRAGSWLDRVLGGALQVCAAEPGEGTPVQPRSTVTLITQRDC